MHSAIVVINKPETQESEGLHPEWPRRIKVPICG
jgi:hypothetical protein